MPVDKCDGKIEMTTCGAYEAAMDADGSGYVGLTSLEKKKVFASYESILCLEPIYEEIGRVKPAGTDC